VFHIVEILVNILSHCSWASIVNVSHANVHGRKTVYALIRQRFHILLLPFIDDIPYFFTLLKELKGAIVGSTAWNILSIDDVEPRDLNIVIPSGIEYAIERIKAYLACSGTTVMFDGAPSTVYASLTTWFIRILRHLGKTITVTLSKSASIVPIVVSSPLTCQTNIITATNIYCFYPNLLSQREAARGMPVIQHLELEQLMRRGIWCLGSNTPWPTACRNACLPLWRRTEALDGVAILHWGGYRGSSICNNSNSFTDDIGFSNFKWRLGIQCFNINCPNSTNISLI
ncbi:hypothetical protein BYT27DRAFT_7114880, partial [Phlegmacium glaucopus]